MCPGSPGEGAAGQSVVQGNEHDSRNDRDPIPIELRDTKTPYNIRNGGVGSNKRSGYCGVGPQGSALPDFEDNVFRSKKQSLGELLGELVNFSEGPVEMEGTECTGVIVGG